MSKWYHTIRVIWANEDPPYDPYRVPCAACDAEPYQPCFFTKEQIKEQEKSDREQESK